MISIIIIKDYIRFNVKNFIRLSVRYLLLEFIYQIYFLVFYLIMNEFYNLLSIDNVFFTFFFKIQIKLIFYNLLFLQIIKSKFYLCKIKQ